MQIYYFLYLVTPTTIDKLSLLPGLIRTYWAVPHHFQEQHALISSLYTSTEYGDRLFM